MEHESDTCFIALTRPAMKWGVPLEGFLVNLCVTFLFSAWFNHLAPPPAWWIGIGVPVHFVMRYATSVDYNFFRVWRLFVETKGRSLATEEWGGSSLSPLPARWPRQARELAISV